MDSYEAGFSKLTTVFDEIVSYIQQRFVGSTEFGDEITQVSMDLQVDENDTILLHCAVDLGGRCEVLFEKAIHILANKYDMVNDEDIAQEFIQSLASHLHTHFQTQRGWTVSTDILLKNSFIVSAATHRGIQEWTKELAQLIDKRALRYTYLFDTVKADTVRHEFITDVTDQEIGMLLEEGYIESSSSRAKVREIWEPEICRLVNILPWGNAQAEYWFRNVMLKKKYLAQLSKVGVLTGDVLKIKSYYSGVEDRYIMYV